MRAGTYHRHGRDQSVRRLVQLGGLLVLRDFRFRYRQAYLGYLWAVARPVFAVLVMTGLSGHRDTGIVDLNENGFDLARLGAWVDRVVP